MKKITVLIADDHPIVQQGMKLFLDSQKDITVVGIAENGKQAIEMVRKIKPDVVVMDINMPNIDGIEATRQIRAENPTVQVVVLTSHNQDAMIFPAIKAGALSYLLKSSSPDEVAEAIRAAKLKQARLHSHVAQRLMDEVTGNRKSPEILTTREIDVLKLVAQGMDNQTIAQTLTLSDKTVKTHISNILMKLNLSDRTQAAIYALKEGIVPLDK
jgi:two-component system, NarL family, response regulator LiaR